MSKQLFQLKVKMAKPSFKGIVKDNISGNETEVSKASELIDFVNNNFTESGVDRGYDFDDIKQVENKDEQLFFISANDKRTGKVIDNFSGNKLEYQIMGMIIDFIIKNHIPTDDELDKRAIADEKKAEMEKNKKADFTFPPRTEIKEALMKVSNFTADEIEIMSWSTMYKSYSLIERYGQKGVEEEIRSEEWFKPALEEYLKNK
jgi:hypothetical protein